MEALAVALKLAERGEKFRFVVTPYASAEEILSKHGIPFHSVPLEDSFPLIQKLAGEVPRKTVVINHRFVQIDNLAKLIDSGLKPVVIDQLGNKKVCGSVLINPSIVSQWLEYEYVDTKPSCYFGPQYSLLRPEFQALHKRKKLFSDTNHSVLVTMGGADRTGASLRIAEALTHLDKGIQKTIVLGKGFANMGRIRQMQRGLDSSFFFVQNVNDLGERLWKADVTICAGGLTLYEMACVGAPGIVLWEDDHENIQGHAFAEEKIVWNIGNGMTTSINIIVDAVRTLLSEKKERMEMSRRGKMLVDPSGIDRVCDILCALDV